MGVSAPNRSLRAVDRNASAFNSLWTTLNSAQLVFEGNVFKEA